MIVILSGGVGGARLCAGLVQVYGADRMLMVVNNGDDFDHWGLRVCPDLDTVMYTLSGRVDEQQGWGLLDESWRTLEAMANVGADDWFRIGDIDLATHLRRTERLRDGLTLSQVTEDLMTRFGIAHRVVPSTDDRHRTLVHTDQGVLEFQDYFVRRRCAPALRDVSFDSRGLDDGPARPSPAFAAAMDRDDIEAVIVCPSNPVLSVRPILELVGVRQWLTQRRFPVVAVSPLIGGRAVKGPTAKIFSELGVAASVVGLADFYRPYVDAWLIDDADTHASDALHAQGLATIACNTILSDPDRRRAVATVLAEWLPSLRMTSARS